ncbi:hypothetical protein [Sorangium sp. So ce861]|uniref:hypothetical protein n=1 Tax=unclassified Sorangium TaxID=2621164 RepID=UPI003F62BA27
MPTPSVSSPTPSNAVPTTPFIIRVISADSTKKGAAAAMAGLLVAAVSEAIWPSR